MLLKINIDNNPANDKQETVSTDRISINAPEGFTVEVAKHDGAAVFRLKRGVFSETSVTIEKMIEFGAHTRKFIEYAFDCRNEETIRNNLATLIKDNGVDWFELLAVEANELEKRTEEEATRVLNWYAEHLRDLCPEDDESCSPNDVVTTLIRIAEDDCHLDGDWPLIFYRAACAVDLLSPYACAERYLYRKYNGDPDITVYLDDGITEYVEELEDAYNAFRGDDEDDFLEAYGYNHPHAIGWMMWDQYMEGKEE